VRRCARTRPRSPQAKWRDAAAMDRSLPPWALPLQRRSGMSEPHCPGLRDKCVLIVDDDVDTCEMLGIVLERSGARVAFAKSAAEALTTFQQERPHVLLLDLGLPDEDGFTLLRKVRGLPVSEGGAVPAIALTGYSGFEDREQTRRAGFQGHLVKPVGFSDLLDSVARALRL